MWLSRSTLACLISDARHDDCGVLVDVEANCGLLANAHAVMYVQCSLICAMTDLAGNHGGAKWKLSGDRIKLAPGGANFKLASRSGKRGSLDDDGGDFFSME